MTTRRTFLAQAGLASAGMLLAPGLLKAETNTRIAGLQLYSLRDQLPSDVKGVIGKVAKAGYKEVETFGYDKDKGYWGLHSKDFSKLLKDNGLTTPSGHYGIDSFFGKGDTEELKRYIEVAKVIGQTYVVIPSLNGEFIKSVDECKAVAEKMNKAAEICKTSGLKLGYHNHNFEWKPLGGGATFYDTILQHTDPKLVHMEMDIFWVVRAGQDPVKIFAKHPGRFALVHVKDRDKKNTDLNTEIGKGSIDFKTIIPKAKAAGVTHFIVEQENFTNIDPYVSITESAQYVKNVLHV
ncbi:MAG TPA: sugar phosphate isomerase/epimerase [Mucilaginibacter sp.]|nr:sugar phosphate isomerase/epimerase [Mucilaginibacter sp.]